MTVTSHILQAFFDWGLFNVYVRVGLRYKNVGHETKQNYFLCTLK